MTDELNTLKN